MVSFLDEVARVYVENENEHLSDYCFIFPNRRCGTFFRKYITDHTEGAMMLPQIFTISEFLSSVSDLVEADRMEQLFVIYQEYRKICNERNVEVSDFDKFVYWGDVIISDFNDVDKYLADADKVFTNVRQLREISTNYLTDEQKGVLKKFGFKVSDEKLNYDKFWNDCSDAERKFISLWEILPVLYTKTKEILAKEGKSFSGHIYRATLELIGKEDFRYRYKRYIFVGFSMLSSAESEIFNTIKKRNLADFYWDLYSPFFTSENKASKFVSKYKKEFPSKYDLNIPVDKAPNVNVISVPSNSGQVQCLSELVSDLLKRGEIKSPENAINTAIVLPDESLFLPALESIPSTISKVNITMGLPIKYSSISMLMSSLSSLHKRATKIKEEFTYFHEDVKNVLLNPLVKGMYPDEVKTFLKTIVANRMFRIKLSDFGEEYKELSYLFSDIPDLNNREEVIKYFDRVISSVEKYVEGDNSLENGFVSQYRQSFDQIQEILNTHNIELKGDTFFYLLERTLATVTIDFEGMPLTGLQIMGVLEARNLDFENVILLSVNERVFPKKQFSKSFIPNSIRAAYGLSTNEYQESIYSYYFYRLISKAKNVFLYYDSRTEGMGSGEPSRYIYQLKYLHEKIDTYKALSYNVVAPEDVVIEVKKSDEVMEKLKAYATENSGKSFSASSFKKYLNCPLSFYFEKVENIYFEDEATEFIDSATFGTIVHNILQEIYPRKVVFSSEAIYNIKKSRSYERLITKYINKEYLKKKKNGYMDSLSGECLLIADVVKYYIDAVLDYDSKHGTFVIEESEKREEKYWPELNINFKQYIDRLDRINKNGEYYTRVVDYKTGSDELNVKSIDDLFQTIRSNYKVSGIFQILLYCCFHSFYSEDATKEKCKPVIYKIREINKQEEFAITFDKQIVDDYTPYRGMFMKHMKSIVDEIFNKDVPFTQNPDSNACTYCNYKSICQR